MKAASPMGGLPTLAAMDKRVRFFVGYAVVLIVCLMLHWWLFGWLNEAARKTNAKAAEILRTERISKQTWWIEEDRAARAEIDTAKGRFWRGDTIGLVRAEVEQFIQQQLTKRGLKAQSITIDSKIANTKGIPLLRAQLKLIGPTAGVLAMLDDLASGPAELFIAGATLQLRAGQALIEVTVDAPTLANPTLAKEESSDKPLQ